LQLHEQSSLEFAVKLGAGIFEIVSVVLGLEDGYFELGSGVVELYFELKLCAHCLSGSGVVELYFELKLCFNCLCGSGLVELYFELGSGVVELSAGISDLFAEMRKTSSESGSHDSNRKVLLSSRASRVLSYGQCCP